MSTKVFSDLVDQRARAYAEIHDCDYQTAFHAVLNDNPTLKAAYTGVKAGKNQVDNIPLISTASYTQKRAGDEVHERVLDLLGEDESTCSYAEGLRVVLQQNPNLARRYSGIV